MAQIRLSDLKHSYYPDPNAAEDYALKEINLTWKDGGAYALLGPSGCGKTTLLNIISGLLTPYQGEVFFDGVNVTREPPDRRNIAQVFQFPVIYDTMSVWDNLAFPLKNRGADNNEVARRVNEIAEMLEVTPLLKVQAAGLSPDNKQKISLGRGLVREDVNVVMFDEPLTVIDPHLKWQLRSKLKELHQKVGITMIYVTHDQTEALTFADEVVVMNDGEVVQIGTPVELFERPEHTFVGHFIGSPGMNIIACEAEGKKARFEGFEVELEGPITDSKGFLAIGIRPEHVSVSHHKGIPARLAKVVDSGRHYIVNAWVGKTEIKAITYEPLPGLNSEIYLTFQPEKTRVYCDGRLATEVTP